MVSRTRLDLVFEVAEHPTDEVLQRHLAPATTSQLFGPW